LRGEPRREGRRWLLVLAWLVPLGPFVLFARAARQGGIEAWDAHGLALLHGYEERVEGSLFDQAVNGVLEFVGEFRFLVLGLVLLSISLLTRRPREALFLVVATATVAALTLPLKDAFERPDVKYAFPSGHAAVSAVVATAAAVIAWPTRWRWPTLAIGAPLTAAFGAALVYEDWHLPSDVLGGWCLAVTCAGLLGAAFFGRAGRGTRLGPSPASQRPHELLGERPHRNRRQTRQQSRAPGAVDRA
jgi:membrane-associated phospholipid phosphatase